MDDQKTAKNKNIKKLSINIKNLLTQVLISAINYLTINDKLLMKGQKIWKTQKQKRFKRLRNPPE